MNEEILTARSSTIHVGQGMPRLSSMRLAVKRTCDGLFVRYALTLFICKPHTGQLRLVFDD